MMAKTVLPTNLLSEARMVNNAKWSFPNMAHYEIQEQVIDLLFRKKSILNTDVEMVRTKAKTLNLYYGTYIQSIKLMADGIYNANIDSRLQKGDITLVEDIANILPRRNYSFATKYCACHQPDKFPIFDNIVGEYLAKLISKGHLKGYSYSKTNAYDLMHANYAFYKEVYDAFMKQYKLTSLSYRQVDWYLWTANKQRGILRTLNLFKLI